MRNEIRQAIKDGNLYDFIANNYCKIRDYELAEIIKNMAFTAYEMRIEEEFNDKLIENLTDVDFFTEEEQEWIK